MTKTDASDKDLAARPEELVLRMRTVTRGVQAFLAARAKELGLGTTDFIALIRTTNTDGVTGAQLAHAFGMRSSSITDLADRLQAKGLIARRPHPTDRRTIRLHATRTGQSAVNRAIGPLLRRLTTLADELDTNQRATIAAFLDEIDAALSGSAPATAARRTNPRLSQ
jgi:DNA-binding MarR family transcriptional regulator